MRLLGSPRRIRGPLAPLLAQQPFDAVLCSPLQRARRTCELAGLAAHAQIEPDLQEWDYGAYEGITTAEIRRTVPAWTVFSHPCPGGESPQQVQQRCERVIQRSLQNPLAGAILEGRVKDGETVQVTVGLDGLEIGEGMAEAA